MAMPWSLLSGQASAMMPARLIYAIFWLLSVAMLILVCGFLCFQMGFGLLTGICYSVASYMMLVCFGMLILIGLLTTLVSIYGDLRSYFCREATALRRLLAVQMQKNNHAQRTELKFRQLQYFSRFKRQRMLMADNRKHLRVLYDSINQELQQAKPQIPKDSYHLLYQSLRRYHKQANAAAMLALRQQIPCR